MDTPDAMPPNANCVAFNDGETPAKTFLCFLIVLGLSLAAFSDRYFDPVK